MPESSPSVSRSAEITAAIDLLNRRDDCDLLIVGRGGGSMEELWAFNEERVARAIFASQIPIISAVGHEIDFTIADFVADVRAPTPSAAAELAVPVIAEVKATIMERRRQLGMALRQWVVVQAKRVTEFRVRLRDPRERFTDFLLRIDGFRERLRYTLQVALEARRQHMAKLISNLDLLSPLAILAKGYAVIQRPGTVLSIRSARELKVGEELKLLFHEGSAHAKVTKIER